MCYGQFLNWIFGSQAERVDCFAWILNRIFPRYAWPLVALLAVGIVGLEVEENMKARKKKPVLDALNRLRITFIRKHRRNKARATTTRRVNRAKDG